MNILQIEEVSSNLRNNLRIVESKRIKLFLIYDFFNALLEDNKTSILKAFIPEFLPVYLKCLKDYKPFSCHPQYTEHIIEQAEVIADLDFLSNSPIEIILHIKRIKTLLEELNLFLDGTDLRTEAVDKIYFPVLELSELVNGDIGFGLLESLSVSIHKEKIEDIFIIIPSGKEVEKRLEDQIHISWQRAIEFLRKYVRRTIPFHKVIINLESKEGVLEGNSLGAALTIAFIKQLFDFYNIPITISAFSNIAITGGLDLRGRLLPVGQNNIERKVECAFYSFVNLLIMHKADESFALNKLAQLKMLFPEKHLDIIPVDTIDDILNRRNIIEMKKINLVIRGVKILRRNWLSAAASIIITALLFLLFIFDFDNNPGMLSFEGNYLLVKNKNGKLLWSKVVGIPNDARADSRILSKFANIYDINNESEHKVFVISEYSADKKNTNHNSIMTCYGFRGDVNWTFIFSDTVSSERELLKPFYNLAMIDTLTFEGTKCLYLRANNIDSFSSAIFRINLSTGKKLPGILWCSGHTYDGLIKDINNNGKRDLLCLGADNGFEDIVIFGFEIDTLTTVRQTSKDYLIKSFPLKNLITYIRIPKNDLDIFKVNRISGIGMGTFWDNESERKYSFINLINASFNSGSLWYGLDYNLKDFEITVGNDFRVVRDSLVASGKLNPPYSDTPEYIKLLKSKILYYNNGNWLKREEL